MRAGSRAAPGRGSGEALDVSVPISDATEQSFHAMYVTKIIKLGAAAQWWLGIGTGCSRVWANPAAINAVPGVTSPRPPSQQRIFLTPYLKHYTARRTPILLEMTLGVGLFPPNQEGKTQHCYTGWTSRCSFSCPLSPASACRGKSHHEPNAALSYPLP